jgi:hypothetical protein
LYPANPTAKGPERVPLSGFCVTKAPSGALLCGFFCVGESLKSCAGTADERGMFVACAEVPRLSEEGLRGLCLSLNSPVVHTDELPLGPVRAAIACHDHDGMPSLTVALRSLDGPAATAFRWDGELDDADDVEGTIAIAQDFAESLGFLFDDDLVARHGGNASAAASSWRELVAEDEEAELLLDRELADAEAVGEDADGVPSFDVAAEPDEDEPAPAQAEAATNAVPALSKFRRARPAERPSDPPAHEALGLSGPPQRANGALGRLLACF